MGREERKRALGTDFHLTDNLLIFPILFRVSDRGGGIPHDRVSKVMNYNFSTAEESTDQMMEEQVFGNLMETCNRTTSGPMHG